MAFCGIMFCYILNGLSEVNEANQVNVDFL